ncbi:Similar to Hivep1: Zinc finger protein 40 (Mus musculus) [Cotesia congregata]|uniref:Similar to Hivep1: Zinc finger protein 40 (Mus musculus) n=1 Tax=Cotesia congregata TaxID=51543 RepID=A0A8J2HKX6_COTCN|nr:Similar to Hivep1: Zinc finger protein 40 (Mus musculus) [Cotesia congregata]
MIIHFISAIHYFVIANLTIKTQAVAMTDPQLANNTSCNNNNKTNPIKTIIHQTDSSEVTRRAPASDVTKSINNNNNSKESSKAKESSESSSEPPETKKTGYVCPYCKMSCSKPSVLQKHIRAHTNERPYPCLLCGFAFKTKSNLYKHRRSRAHTAKAEGTADQAKVSEDSDISLSDSASNGTGTPPPLASSVVASNHLEAATKTVKTGKIYKPKFHTALESVNNDPESLSVSPLATTISTSTSSLLSSSSIISSSSNGTSTVSIKPNAEQLQEHIDKIITDNQAIVEAVDPRLHKLMHRQQSHPAKPSEQPLNLSSSPEVVLSSRKRHLGDTQEDKNQKPQLNLHLQSEPANQGSIIKDLLLKNRDDFVCANCKISYTSADNLEAHKRYYCKVSSSSSSLSSSSSSSSSPSPKRDFQLDLEKRDNDDTKSEYYNTVKPLPSPGPLLGNTRLVDAYTPPVKKHCLTELTVPPTSLRSLEELSKYPRPNSLQMFGGQVRILDNTGETKTMRIEPRQTNSPSDDMTNHNSKSGTSETSSIVVRSSLHSGGTMVHKPPGGTSVSSSVTNSLSNSISMPNAPQMLAPIIPNISTPNIAPTMTCYGNYLEPRLNPLTITAYNPLTLPSGISSIMHGGKIIPYVPGMPGPHTLMSDISQPQTDSYKLPVPGAQPLDLASPVKVGATTPYVPGIPGPEDSVKPLFTPLDLAKDPKVGFKLPTNGGVISPKIVQGDNKYRRLSSCDFKNNNNPEVDNNFDRHIHKNSKYKLKDNYDKNFKTDNVNINGNVNFERSSPKLTENRKRPASWGDDGSINDRRSPLVAKYEHGEGRVRMSPETVANGVFLNGRARAESVPPVIIMDLDTASIQQEPKSSPELIVSLDSKQSPSLEREVEEKTTKFLRPSSLPLKPGTFTPKRHHGITPTPYTQPLISPETPRPRKSYGQLYLNGHAYTYLGLKCSTRVYYCTLNRPQPMYVTQQHHLSMYSNWKIFNDLRPDRNLANYDSRNRSSSYTIAWKKQELLLTHSSYKPVKLNSSPSPDSDSAQKMARRIKIFDGGFESNEDYTYVRGRGRGRYVCEECGIRCKKPSMLKKHIRTHTDVRPYTCKYCSFSFKTKGNLTKHMKSKAHYKKCRELGIDPVPTTVCDENIDKEAIARLTAGGGENADESSEEEDDESDNEESEESGTDEHEAARSLLILSQPSKNRLQIPGLVPACRPATYPYALTTLLSTSTSTATTTTASTGSVTSATVIQSEAASNRYYFPSRSLDSSRDSVIRSTKVEEAKEEIIEGPAGEAEDHQGTRGTTQPMDLTTKPAILDCAKRSSVDILTPVSEPILMQTIVQTMERLPPGREWKPDAEGHMLQAYLTERHVMDSKIKQQYRVGGFKVEKKVFSGSKLENSRGSLFSSSTPTVTYTDSRMQFAGKKEDVGQKVEAKSERRPFDIESLHSQELLRPRVNTQEYLVGRNYPEVGQELKPLGNETREAVASHERQDFIPSPGREARYERPVRPVSAGLEFKVPCSEFKDRETPDTKEFRPMEPRLVNEIGLRPLHDARSNSERVLADVKINVEGLGKQIGVAVVEGIKQQHNVVRKMVVAGPGFRSPSPSRAGKPMAEFLPPSGVAPNYVSIGEDGRSTCGICNKVFNKPSQLKLHINIHYFERPFRCESCAVSFRTKGHLTKHERSVSHHNKVSMTSTFGAPTTSNPRPFKCTDCKIAFRIHGHLAKHLRSKMHIMKLESSQYQQSIPPTTTTTTTTSSGEASSDEGEPIPQFPVSPTSSPSAFTPATDIPSSVSRAYHSPILSVISDRNKSPVESHVPNSRFEDKNLPASSSSSVDTHLPNAFICQTCTTSFRNLVDLQVHCFVEHNIDNRNHPSESGPTNENNIKQTNDVDINKVHDKSDDA